MQILLANAKIMFGKTDRKPLSTPLFQTTADMLAAEMAKMNMEDLARQLDCSKKIATENWIRFCGNAEKNSRDCGRKYSCGRIS